MKVPAPTISNVTMVSNFPSPLSAKRSALESNVAVKLNGVPFARILPPRVESLVNVPRVFQHEQNRLCWGRGGEQHRGNQY